jgi:hypothetical protein
MIVHHQMVLAAALLSLVGHRSADVARASQVSHDPPFPNISPGCLKKSGRRSSGFVGSLRLLLTTSRRIRTTPS